MKPTENSGEPIMNLVAPFSAYQGQKPYLFVSYAHADSNEVYGWIKRLHGDRWRVWYDEGIDPGNDWGESIALALKQAAQMILFISENAVASPNVSNEMMFAHSHGIPILCVYLRATDLPVGWDLQLSRYQALMPARYQDKEQFYRRFTGALNAQTRAEPEEDILPAPDRSPPSGGTSPPVDFEGISAHTAATIAAGGNQTVGLKADGTVVAVGLNDDGQCNVSGWRDIIEVSAGGRHTVGLKADGTVIAAGNNISGECDVSDWRDIIEVAAGTSYTVGLKADGTVVAKGYNYYGPCDVSDWRDITAVAAGGNQTVGLKADGTVVAVGNNESGQCDVSGWRDIIEVSAGGWHTVGLKADGTVIAVGYNGDGECDVADWRGIIAVAAGDGHTFGLKSDGTVVAMGRNIYGQCNISGWRNIIAIAARGNHTIGLKADGTVVAVGNNESGQCDVSGWSGLMLPTRAKTGA